MDLNERIERKKNFFLNRSNISASELKEIKSIDLRIPKQAIIKFKN